MSGEPCARTPLSVRISSVASTMSLRGNTSASPSRQVDSRRDAHDGGRDLVACLIGLDLHLAGIQNDVRVLQDTLAFDHPASGGHFARPLLYPPFEPIR